MLGFYFCYIYKLFGIRGELDWERFDLGISIYKTGLYLYIGFIWIDFMFLKGSKYIPNNKFYLTKDGVMWPKIITTFIYYNELSNQLCEITEDKGIYTIRAGENEVYQNIMLGSQYILIDFYCEKEKIKLKF